MTEHVLPPRPAVNPPLVAQVVRPHPWILVAVAGGAAILMGSIVRSIALDRPTDRNDPWVMAVLFGALAVTILVQLFRERIEVHPDRVRVVHLFRVREFGPGDIAGVCPGGGKGHPHHLLVYVDSGPTSWNVRGRRLDGRGVSEPGARPQHRQRHDSVHRPGVQVSRAQRPSQTS